MMDHSDDRMIRIDMTDQTVSIESYPEEWKLLGGRALSARILLDECDPAATLVRVTLSGITTLTDRVAILSSIEHDLAHRFRYFSFSATASVASGPSL
jgi:hypothetical protein